MIYIRSQKYPLISESEKYIPNTQNGTYYFMRNFYGRFIEFIKVECKGNKRKCHYWDTPFFDKNDRYEIDKLQFLTDELDEFIPHKECVQIPKTLYDDVINSFVTVYSKGKSIIDSITNIKEDKNLAYKPYQQGIFYFTSHRDDDVYLCKLNYKDKNDCHIYYRNMLDGSNERIRYRIGFHQEQLFDYCDSCEFDDENWFFETMKGISKENYNEIFTNMEEYKWIYDSYITSLKFLDYPKIHA